MSLTISMVTRYAPSPCPSEIIALLIALFNRFLSVKVSILSLVNCTRCPPLVRISSAGTAFLRPAFRAQRHGIWSTTITVSSPPTPYVCSLLWSDGHLNNRSSWTLMSLCRATSSALRLLFLSRSLCLTSMSSAIWAGDDVNLVLVPSNWSVSLPKSMLP